MARYYEETALIEFVKQYTPHINGETTMQCVERAIRNASTADVVPKSELHDDHHKQVACYTLGCREGDKIRREVAREIIKDLKKLLQPYETEFKRGNVTIDNLHCYPTYKGYSIPKYEVDAFIAELKKKYTDREK